MNLIIPVLKNPDALDRDSELQPFPLPLDFQVIAPAYLAVGKDHYCISRRPKGKAVDGEELIARQDAGALCSRAGIRKGRMPACPRWDLKAQYPGAQDIAVSPQEAVGRKDGGEQVHPPRGMMKDLLYGSADNACPGTLACFLPAGQVRVMERAWLWSLRPRGWRLGQHAGGHSQGGGIEKRSVFLEGGQ